MNWLTLNTTLRAILQTLGAILVALGWTDAAGETGLSEHGAKLLDAVIALVGSGLWLSLHGVKRNLPPARGRSRLREDAPAGQAGGASRRGKPAEPIPPDVPRTFLCARWNPVPAAQAWRPAPVRLGAETSRQVKVLFDAGRTAS